VCGKATAAPLTAFVCVGEPVGPAASVARRFGRAIAAEVRRVQPSTLFLTGGDTAIAALRALGSDTLDVRGEAAAGLPWSVLEVDGKPTAVVTKSGGFGSEDVLFRVLGRPKRAGRAPSGSGVAIC
jgi:uncharacterized protein YgbK (DUF1537 family)